MSLDNKKGVVEMEKKKRSLFIRLALLLFAGYIVVMLVGLQMQINEKQAEIDKKQTQIREYQNQNADLQEKVENSDSYLEQQARENGYVSPNADVYIEIP